MKFDRQCFLALSEKAKQVWMDEMPEYCDICEDKLTDVFIDGKTKDGPWATMCSKCHKKHGVGLGIGKGQKYCLKTGEKIEG